MADDHDIAERPFPVFDDPAEEARFRIDRDLGIARGVNAYVPFAIAVVIASAIGHVLLYPRYVWVPTLSLHALCMFLPLATTWWLVRRPTTRRHVYRAMQVTAASAALGVLLVVAIPRSQGFPLPYEGILLVIMSVFLLSGLRTRDASLIGLVCVIGVIAIEWTWQTSRQDAVVRPFFALAVWLLGSVFNQFIERANRRDFRQREMLQALSQKDPLTGLLNRRGLADRFEILAATTRRSRHPVTVAIVDLDHFKAYNDTWGHGAGDAVLVAVSAVLARHARRPLDLVARMGGEEFLLAWYDVDAVAGKSLAWQVCADIAQLEHPQENTAPRRRVTASLGVATARGDCDLENLYRRADAALYVAKNAGRNCVAEAEPEVTAAPPDSNRFPEGRT